MNKTIGFLFLLLLLSSRSFADPKVIIPIPSQPDYLTTQAIAGADANNNIVPFKVGTDGTFQILDKKNPIVNDNVTITGNGATQRTQFPTHTVSSCTLRAYSANSGTVYVGSSTVTNASGASRGFPLAAGEALSALRVDDSNELYGAADNANDKISILCN